MLTKFKNWLQLNYDEERTRSTYYNLVKECYLYGKKKITQESLNNYLLTLDNKRNATYNLFLCAMRSYCKFSKLELEFPKSRRREKMIKEYITIDQLRDEILPMTSLLFTNWKKQECILLTLFFTGMRKGELVNLRRGDIDFENEVFIVRESKSNSYRIIPFLDNKFVEKLKEYVKYEEEKTNAFNITKDKISYLLSKIKRELNLKMRFYPHILRTSFAKYCNDIGFSVADIKYLMGHASIVITEEYIQSDERAVLKKAKELRR